MAWLMKNFEKGFYQIMEVPKWTLGHSPGGRYKQKVPQM